jgi:hypothetical protein
LATPLALVEWHNLTGTHGCKTAVGFCLIRDRQPQPRKAMIKIKKTIGIERKLSSRLDSES